MAQSGLSPGAAPTGSAPQLLPEHRLGRSPKIIASFSRSPRIPSLSTFLASTAMNLQRENEMVLHKRGSAWEGEAQIVFLQEEGFSWQAERAALHQNTPGLGITGFPQILSFLPCTILVLPHGHGGIPSGSVLSAWFWGLAWPSLVGSEVCPMHGEVRIR